MDQGVRCCWLSHYRLAEGPATDICNQLASYDTQCLVYKAPIRNLITKFLTAVMRASEYLECHRGRRD